MEKLSANNFFKRQALFCGLAIAFAWFSSATPAFGGNGGISSAPKDYSSCIINSISVDISVAEVSALQDQCRSEFPVASSFANNWATVGHCYDYYEPNASNRKAAIAIFDACAEYFL